MKVYATEMKTSLIACVAGVNNSGEREGGQHACAPRAPEIPISLPHPCHFKAYHAGYLPQSTEISVFIENQYTFLLTSFSMRFLVFLIA